MNTTYDYIRLCLHFYRIQEKEHLLFIARSKPDGKWWRTGGEVKGKDANGVGSQQPCTVRRNRVYPALLPTLKTCEKLASSMVSCELMSKIRQFQRHCFHITLNYCWHNEFSCFPYYMIRYICQLQLCWHTVAVVQYTFTHKSAGCAPSLQVLPWYLPDNWGKSTEKPVRVAEEC